MTKRTSLQRAISSTIADGQTIYMGGFTHMIPFEAGHEMIRQELRDLHLVRATPDLVFDRMIAAGCAAAVTFSWAGNPGVGGLRAFRRAIEDEVPTELEIHEYSHYGLIARLSAGAQGLPFVPLRTFTGSDIPTHNSAIRTVSNPYDTGPADIHVVPPLTPDVAIVRAQRADENGNAHLWGIQGDIIDAAFAAETVVLIVEELVSEAVIRSDPNRTAIPGTLVDYVVEEPYGSHPSYAQGYYDRDNDSYLAWDNVSRSQESIEEWLDEWVYSVEDQAGYLEKLGVEKLMDLTPRGNYATPVDLGQYA